MGAPASSPAEAFFDAIAGRYERAYALPSEESRRRMARVVAALPSPPATVLDLGVGTGRELPALLDAGYAPTGLDVSRAMIDRCARRARPIPLLRADFWTERLPFESGAFDAAVALHGTLAHPPDEGALERLGIELARVVRGGGRLVIEAPSPAWLEQAGKDGKVSLGADRAVRRTGERSCVYDDLVTGASIAASFLDENEWKSVLAAAWDVRVETASEVEWLVLARRNESERERSEGRTRL
jgi:SAM-dependent methyltransferase